MKLRREHNISIASVRPQRVHRLARLFVVACAAVCISNAGCSQRTAQAGKSLPLKPSDAGARETTVGVDIAVWPIDETRLPVALSGGTPAQRAALARSQSLSEALAPFEANAVPIPPETLRRWREAGMSMMLVPRAQLQTLEASLRIAASVQQQEFAMTPRWSQAFRGPFARGSHSVVLDDGVPTDISQGAFRLLMRCYQGDEGHLRLDLVPQHVARAAAAADAQPGTLTLQAPVSPRGATVEGVVFSSLLLEMQVPAGFALVVFPGTLSPVQSAPAPIQSTDAPATQPTTGASEPALQMPDAPAFVETQRTLGPEIPESLTLGDVLLTDMLGGGRGSMRAVLIFAPRAR